MNVVPGKLMVEVVMATKEVNEQARTMGFHVLSALGERIITCEQAQGGPVEGGLTIESVW
jgi:hypothetical protein